MKVVKMMVAACALLAAGVVFGADEDQKPRAEGERGGFQRRLMEMRQMQGGMDMSGNWVSRFLMQEENLEKLGLDEAPRKKLIAELDEITKKMNDIQKRIREVGLEQGKMMREAMETPGADMAPIFAKVREIGGLRTEQSVLSTKIFAVVRDNLTKEQHARVRELVMTEGRQRMEARREFNGNMERRRPQFEGRRRGQGEGGEGNSPENRGRRRGGQGGQEGRGRRWNREGGDRPAEKPAE